MQMSVEYNLSHQQMDRLRLMLERWVLVLWSVCIALMVLVCLLILK